jgi:hypothetical protein
MPLEPPVPLDLSLAIEALVFLRAAQAVLRRAEQADPPDHTLGAVAADVDAAIAKIEAIARPGA